MNKHAQKTWQDCLLETFEETVKAPYGDFAAIGRLIAASHDAENLEQIINWLSQSPQARSALQKRITLGDIDLQALHRLSPNTFGYAYAEHMLGNGLQPIKLPVSGDDGNYLIAHLTETHDIWHTISGFDTSMVGEIKLQAFVTAQLRFSRFSLAMLAKNMLKTAIDAVEETEERLDAVTCGWSMGKQARPLFGVQWNTLWDMPLEQLRTEFNILPRYDSTTLFSQYCPQYSAYM